MSSHIFPFELDLVYMHQPLAAHNLSFHHVGEGGGKTMGLSPAAFIYSGIQSGPRSEKLADSSLPRSLEENLQISPSSIQPCTYCRIIPA